MDYDIIARLEKEPMARYIPNNAEIQNICDQYHIGDFIHVDMELGGLYNVNLKITTTQGQYVIRIHSGLSRQNHLEAESSLITKLIENEVPALSPLYTITNEFYLILHTRFVQVTPFVESGIFRSSKKQVYESGKILRKMHDVLADETNIPTPYWSNYPSQEILDEGMYVMQNEQGQLHDREAIEKVVRLYNKITESWLQYEGLLETTVVHADWHPWNVLFSEEGEIRCVLDFDFVQRGERIHDIAYFLWAIRHADDFEEVGKEFLKGYGGISELETEILPLAIARASVFFICTASFTANPQKELQDQMKEQEPYIEWLLSTDGINQLKKIYGLSDYRNIP